MPDLPPWLSSRLAHQSLRPQPQREHEQRIDCDVLVGRADRIGRDRLDDADQQPGGERAGNAAEAAQRDGYESDDRQRLADGRRDVEEVRDQRAGNAGRGGG
jgi:hypothetical protein